MSFDMYDGDGYSYIAHIVWIKRILCYHSTSIMAVLSTIITVLSTKIFLVSLWRYSKQADTIIVICIYNTKSLRWDIQ